MEGVPSPYVIDFEKYTDSFDTYDDLPATVAWIHSVGAALGKKFGVTIVPSAPEWEIDHPKMEMRVGSIDDIYTRRGVLGLLLNGVGRLGLSIRFPDTNKDALLFAKEHGVVTGNTKKIAKQFGALAKTIDEVRTDDEVAKSYAGGERVVDTMHAQAYEAANKALQMMALDMRMRREMARVSLDWFKELSILGTDASKEAAPADAPDALKKRAARLIEMFKSEKTAKAIEVSFATVMGRIEKHPNVSTQGRKLAVLLTSLFPAQTDEIMKVFVRAYKRNATLFGGFTNYAPVTKDEEASLIKLAAVIQKDVDEVKLFAGHTGGHAQYVIAKAEQYYHAHTLGIQVVTPYAGYDMEAKALEVEEANEAARQIAYAMVERGITADITDSIEFTKELLPIVEPFPFLDLNDRSKQDPQGNGKGGNGSMQKRVAGAGNGQRKQKRDKQRESKSAADRAKDRKKMEAKNNQQNQKDVDEARNGYSIMDKNLKLDPLDKYLYIIGPYLSRIQTAAQRIRRILKVNDPAGLRGAHRRGPELNTRILYRHRLNDFHLFSRKEVDKDQSYGFAVMGDLSGSTNGTYGQTNRKVMDEVLAASFLMAEIAERIGDKVMCSIGFFTDTAENTKRAGNYLARSKIVEAIQNWGGGTNVEAAGELLEEDLQELTDFKIKNKTVVFITDGSFDSSEFLLTVKAAKKHKASIAYFQICDDVQYGVQMCKEVEAFVAKNAKGVRVRSRNLPTSGINGLPEAMVMLMKETVGVSDR